MNAIARPTPSARDLGTEWVDAGAASDVPLRGSRVMKSPVGDIAIFKALDGTFFALRDRCPHKGGPLSQGIVHGYSVTCPLHNWVISLMDGEAQGADKGCTPKIPLKLEAGRILLSTDALAALGAGPDR